MSKWTNGVKDYTEELMEFLDENKLTATKENMLNGAKDWTEYSYGGSSLIYDMDIAERLATPSEIKRRTLKRLGRLDTMANADETWLDVQARALYQACDRILRYGN
jgi:hypothetical protein